MKPWPSTDRSSLPKVGADEFLGRTPEEALAKAAAALGPSAELRCWKTRRGGVGGFFATEVYVAGSTPPKGAESAPALPGPPSVTAQASKLADEASLSAPVPAPDQLAALVDGTTDQLSLRPEVVPSAAFDALLAEAEAALSLDTVPAAEPPVAQPPAPAVVVSAAFAPLDTPAAENADAHPSGPGRIPGLRDRLRVLGVPECYLPQGEEPSIDALARSLGTLPEAPPLPAQPGAVVLLVSAEPLLERSVETLLGALGLGRRDVVRCDVDSLATDEADARRAETVRVRAAVRVARRRATGSTTLVGLSSGARKAEPAAVAEMIDCIRPDYVLAAVDASTKRADAVPWFEGLGAVNAAAVWGLDDTRTPGELLGALPVSFADGKACSPVSWTAALLARVADELA